MLAGDGLIGAISATVSCDAILSRPSNRNTGLKGRLLGSVSTLLSSVLFASLFVIWAVGTGTFPVASSRFWYGPPPVHLSLLLLGEVVHAFQAFEIDILSPDDRTESSRGCVDDRISQGQSELDSDFGRS